jgi:hypothetical protein
MRQRDDGPGRDDAGRISRSPAGDRATRFTLGGRPTVTTTDAASMLGVSSVITVQLWASRGLFPGAITTPGGHWRIPVEDVVSFQAARYSARMFNRHLQVPLATQVEPFDEELPG